MLNKFLNTTLLLACSIFSVAQPIFSSKKTLGSTANEKLKCMTTDANGYMYAVGLFTGTVDFDPSAATHNLTAGTGLEDMYIAKYDQNGDYVWAVRISSTIEIQPTEVKIDNWGGVVYCGYFKGTASFNPNASTQNLTSNGGYDAFIARLNSNGTFDTQNGYANKYGGPGDDYATTMSLTNQNQTPYLAGTFTGTADFGDFQGTPYTITATGSRDIFILKMLGNSGSTVFPGTIAGNNSITCDKIVCDNNQHILITGKFSTQVDFDLDPPIANPDTVHHYLNSGGFGTHSYLAMYSINMGYFYARDLGANATPTCLTADLHGNAYLSGTFTGTNDFDPNPTTTNLTSAGATDIFIAKYNANGDLQWAKQLGGTSDETSKSIAISADTLDNNLYLTGSFSGNHSDFNASLTDSTILSSNGLKDAFITKYRKDGIFIWAYGLGGSNDDEGKYIGTNLNFLNVAGEFSSVNVDFDVLQTTSTASTAGGSDIFISKYMQCDFIDLNIDVQTIYIQSTFGATPYAAASGFQWLDCGNNFAIVPGETNAVYQFSPVSLGNGGPFAVEISYNGCVDTTYCANLLTVGLQNAPSENIDFTLNTIVTNGVLNINYMLPSNHKINLNVYDVTGKKVLELENNFAPQNQSSTYNISQIQKGVYVVALSSEGRKQTTHKIVVN